MVAKWLHKKKVPEPKPWNPEVEYWWCDNWAKECLWGKERQRVRTNMETYFKSEVVSPELAYIHFVYPEDIDYKIPPTEVVVRRERRCCKMPSTPGCTCRYCVKFAPVPALTQVLRRSLI